MPSAFQANGAAQDPSKSAPLHTNRFFTGLWTQRSPLRDAATPYLYEKFYSASRFDSLIGGTNMEITTRLTLARRPGCSVYNSNALPYQRLASFRTFVNNAEQVRVMADVGSTGPGDLGSARDVTGIGGNEVVLQKVAGSRTTFFQSVGNILFLCDEAQAKKWVLSSFAWQPATVAAAGTFLVDENGNLQYSKGGGQTGGAEPAWPLRPGQTVQDGSVLWAYKGSSVQKWGIDAPKNAPVTALTLLNQVANKWTANTFFNPALALYDTASGTMQQLVTAGVTATTNPQWATTPGAQTTHGQSVWQCLGSGAWAPNAGHGAGDLIYVQTYDPVVTGGGNYAIFRAATAGVTGAALPQFPAGPGSMVLDGTVIWENAAEAYVTTTLQINSNLGVLNSLLTEINDSKGGLQEVYNTGVSGTAEPAWNEVEGAYTYDRAGGTQGPIWQCAGEPANVTKSWQYVYAFRNAVTGHVSTGSPASVATMPQPGGLVVLTGIGSTDPQVDTVRIYRTAQGGSTFLFLADVPVALGASWSYFDDAPDSSLNPLIQAAIADANDPPPATLSAPAYHLDRIWAFNGNVLLYSGGPDTTEGSGNEAWPPLNYFIFPSRGVRLWPTSIGLLVFTQSDVYIVQGQGTSSSPFYATIFQEGVGLLNYDSFAVNGSTAYLMTTAYRCISFDPGAGETEVGFPIGDILAQLTEAGTHMAYHEGSSADTALYVGDGAEGWYRMSTINAPESGQVWSPQATLDAGVATLASVEIAPGVKKLLIGTVTTGPLQMRDDTKNVDYQNPAFGAGTGAFPATAIIGSVVLAEPGQIAGVQFLTLDTAATGTRAAVGILFNELAGSYTTTTFHYGVVSPFVSYEPSRQDPTMLPPSTTIRGDRYYMGQNGKTPFCRHMQIQFWFPEEDAANEIYAYTIFGSLRADQAEG